MPTKDIKADYGAVGDGQIATRTLTTSGAGNKTLTATASTWGAGVAGNKISIQGAGIVSGANPLGAFLTTIAARASDVEITLQDSPDTPLSSASKLLEWGTNDNTAFTNFKNDFQGQTGVVLNIPAGRYCFASGGSSNGFGFGIRGLQVVGVAGSSTLTDMLGVGNGVFLGSVLAAQINDSSHEARLATVSAGSSSLTLSNVSDASKFSANTWALLTSYDLQSFGYPTNPLQVEWVYITGISGASVTLNAPLSYTHKSTWPHWAADEAGPATLYAISQNWDADHEYINVIVSANATVFNCVGRSITFTGGSAPAFAPNCSSIKNFVASGLDLSTAANWEIDKLNKDVTLSGVTMRGIFFQSPSAETITLDGCTITVGLGGSPRHLIANNTSFADAVFGPSSYGCSSSIYLEDCSISDFSNFGGVAESDVFGAGGYSYNSSTGVITRAKVGGGGAPPQWAFPNTWTLYGSRYIAEGVFKVIDITEDGTNIYIETNLSGAFPSPVAPATQFSFKTHPAVRSTFVNCTGHDAAVSWSTLDAEAPLYSGWNLTYTGNIGTTKPAIQIFGEIISVKFIVNVAYSGGTLNLDGPFVIEKPNNTERIWSPVIDLTQVGTRTITRSGAIGSAGSDSGLTLPGTGGIWLVPGQITPKMSGATGSGNVTLIISVDQGIALDDEGPEPEPEPTTTREVVWPITRLKKRQGPDIGLIRELQRQWAELREADTVNEKLAILDAAKDTAQELAQEPISEQARVAIRRLLLSPIEPPAVMTTAAAVDILAQIEDEEEELEAIIYAIA